MKKKLLSLMLALTMCLGLAAPTLAMDVEEGASAIQIDADATEVEQEYSIYTESCTAGYCGGIDQTVYNSMKSGTPITVSNISTDPTSIVYVYYYKYDFITEPTKVYDTETSYVIQNVYYGSDYNYALTDRNDHPQYINYPELYTPSINGLYWKGSETLDLDMVMSYLKPLHPGESVTFTLPDPAGQDIMYRLHVSVYYPSLDDGTQDCYFYKWYHIKVEDTVPSSSAETPAPTAPATPTAPVITDPIPGFDDVSIKQYYAAPILWATAKGIANGTGTNKFSPEEICSNAQILTFLWRAYGEPEPAIGNPFSNIAESDYYYKAALWACEKGMISGTTFDADKPCTRAMTVTYIWQAAGSPAAASAVSFTDVSASASYAAAVAWAVNQGITNGDGANTFSPDKTCTRGQIVTFLYRALA